MEFAVEVWGESEVEDEVVQEEEVDWEEDRPEHDGVGHGVCGDVFEEICRDGDAYCPDDDRGQVQDHVEWAFEPGG